MPDLPLGPALAEHEEQAADDDGDQREGACERAGERSLEVACGALPGRLREEDGRKHQHSRNGQGERVPDARGHGTGGHRHTSSGMRSCNGNRNGTVDSQGVQREDWGLIHASR